MTQAFDLEQDIIRCWGITTDIGEILDDLETGKMGTEEAVTALRAYQKVYEHRFDRCFRRFEAYNQEAWLFRQRVQELEQNLDSVPETLPKKAGKMAKSKEQKEVDH